MTKKAKILIILFSFSLLLILYLFFTSEPINKKIEPDKEVKSGTTKIEQLEISYRQQAQPIVANYLGLLKNNYTIDQVSQIKNKLLDLRVPTKFKNLHINLVLALTKMENYLTGGKESEKVESQQIISQAKADYDWLNK